MHLIARLGDELVQHNQNELFAHAKQLAGLNLGSDRSLPPEHESKAPSDIQRPAEASAQVARAAETEHKQPVHYTQNPRLREYIELILSTRAVIRDDLHLDSRLVRAASNAMTIVNYAQLCGLLPDFSWP